MKYKASLGSRQKLFTTILVVFIAALNLLTVFLQFKRLAIEFYFLLGVIIPDLVFIYLFLIAPRGYLVKEKGIVVKSYLREKYFPFDSIEKVELLRKSDLAKSIRNSGVGYFFGNYGKFYSRKYGVMIWYLTNKKHLIMIHTKNNERIVLSPDDSNMFDEILALMK